MQNVNALPFVDDTLRTELIARINDINDSIGAISALVGDAKVSDQIASAINGIPQPDWNESDITSPAYIKNRTHYESTKMVETRTELGTYWFHGDGNLLL